MPERGREITIGEIIVNAEPDRSRDRDRLRESSNRDSGGRDRGGRETARSREARTNTETATFNGKPLPGNVTPATKEAIIEFERKLAEMRIGGSLLRVIDGGQTWDGATQAMARKEADDNRIDAQRKGNRGDGAAWDGVLDHLEKMKFLDPRTTEDPLLAYHRQVAADKAARRKEEKKEEKERKEREARRGGAANLGGR